LKEHIGSKSQVLGTAANPINYKFPGNQKIKSGQTISGHGTLVFDQNLVLEAGSRIDWIGNLIIWGGENQSDAFLDVDGILNVTGNVIIIGPEGRNIKFLLRSQGQTTVNGAMTVLADLSNTVSHMEFYVEGDLAVNGS
jgi:hypothetical protein